MKAERVLYKLGGFTSILFILYAIATIIIFTQIPEGFPKTALECFTMLQENYFIGLLRLDVVSVVAIPFYYLFFYSLFYAVKKDHELVAKFAFLLTFAGITIFITGVNTIELISLSDKFHAATSPEIQERLLAAGESLLASDMWFSTGAKIRGILIESGAVIFSILMIRTRVFPRFTSWLGLITHLFDLSSEISSIFIASAKDFFTMVAGPLYFVWFILMAIHFFKLGNNTTPVNYKVLSS